MFETASDKLNNDLFNIECKRNCGVLNEFQFHIWQHIFKVLDDESNHISNVDTQVLEFMYNDLELIEYAKTQIMQCNDKFKTKLLWTKKFFDIWMRENHKYLIDENEYLKRNSDVDSLTDLFNRKAFIRSLFNEYELLRFGERRSHLALIYIDVDNLKPINDVYGHQEGDKLLKTVANILYNETKKMKDLVFRIGGDEFSIMISETTPEDVFNIIERIHNKIKETVFNIYDETNGKFERFEISVSIGLKLSNFRKAGGLANKSRKSIETFYKSASLEEKKLMNDILNDVKNKFSTVQDVIDLIKNNPNDWIIKHETIDDKKNSTEYFLKLLVSEILWKIVIPLKAVQIADQRMFLNKNIKKYLASNNNLMTCSQDGNFNIFIGDIRNCFYNLFFNIPKMALQNWVGRNECETISNIRILKQKIKNINFWYTERLKYINPFEDNLSDINVFEQRSNNKVTFNIKDIEGMFLPRDYGSILKEDIICMSIKLLYLKVDYLKIRAQYDSDINIISANTRDKENLYDMIKQLEDEITQNSNDILDLIRKKSKDPNKNLLIKNFKIK